MKRNEQIDGTEFACLTINADLEAENEKLKKQLKELRENLIQCEADRRFEQEKKNIAMKRVSELKKQLAITEKALELACQKIDEMQPNKPAFICGDYFMEKYNIESRMKTYDFDYFIKQAEKEIKNGIAE